MKPRYRQLSTEAKPPSQARTSCSARRCGCNVELAHYLEANRNDDPATFLLSGFRPVSSTKTPPQPLDQPTVAVEPGAVTGQMKTKIGSVRKALSYQLHCAPVPSGGGHARVMDGPTDYQYET